MDVIALVNAAGAVPAWGIAVICLVQLVRGAIVPYSSLVRQMDEVRKDRDARLDAKNDEIGRLVTERDDWKSAWREAQDIAADVRGQNRDLIESLYFVRKVVASLPGAPRGGDSRE